MFMLVATIRRIQNGYFVTFTVFFTLDKLLTFRPFFVSAIQHRYPCWTPVCAVAVDKISTSSVHGHHFYSLVSNDVVKGGEMLPFLLVVEVTL